MMWFFATLCLAIIVLVAVVATGWGGGMPEAYDDRPDSRVQADRPISAGDLVHVRFSSALRGYRMSEVDTLLDRLAQEMAQREALVRDRPAAQPAAQPAGTVTPSPSTSPYPTAPLPPVPTPTAESPDDDKS